MSILNELNQMQKKAAEKIEGPILILAGAGSGKTRTITYRIAYMIKEKHIDPKNILALTFTNKAAKEMKERALALLKGQEGTDLTISTFHSFSLQLLKKYADVVGYTKNFGVYDVEDQKKLVSKIIKQSENITLKEIKVNDYIKFISNFKEAFKNPDDINEGVDVPYHISKEVKYVYDKYQKELKQNNAMDFSDLLLNAFNLLLNEKVLEKVRDKYKYIIIDEYQDTNKIQYNMVRMIALKYNNICVVGDEDQSIYKFRGADIQNILNFKNDYKDVEVVMLEENYRSTQSILDVANSVIKNNRSSLGKKLFTNGDKGSKVEVFKANTNYDEANYIANKISQLKENKKYNYSDFTILYRVNSQSRALEESLRRLKIPHKVYGGFQFYQRKEIKTILSYLNLVNNKMDNISFLNVINFPKRGIGESSISKISEIANFHNISMLDAIEISDLKGKSKIKANEFKKIFEYIENNRMNMNILQIAKYILEEIDMFKEFPDDKDDREKNILELFESMNSYINEGDPYDLDGYLSSISLFSSSDEINDDDYVRLMTIHSSKGLEFNVVFIAGFEDGIFPLMRFGEIMEDELEEERRLCYVAITRAKKELYVSYAGLRYSYNNDYKPTTSSRFLEEMPKNHLVFTNQYNSNKTEEINKTITFVENFNPFKPKEKKDYAINVGNEVYHKIFGRGKVISVDEKITTVSFMIGLKKISTLMAERVLEKV